MTTKYAIDIDLNKKSICGWVANDSEVATVSISLRGQKIGEQLSDLMRPDLQAAGIHETGRCGFKFSEETTELVVGNFYTVTIGLKDKKIVNQKLYGDHNDLSKVYRDFEVLPRNDLNFLDIPYEKVLTQYDDVRLLKYLLIRLRRGKRAMNSRGKFGGVEYSGKAKDFFEFRSLFEKYMPIWLKLLNARCLWSISDTYADYGSREERLGALAISNYMFAERFSQTRKCVYNMVRKSDAEIKELSNGQQHYWGGMLSNRLVADDSMDVFITRNLEILEGLPAMRAIFLELLKRSATEGDSDFGFNIKNSDHFKSAFEVYKKNFF